jgi:hypothetical protein
MHVTSGKTNERLIQIRRRAIFGRAIRREMEEQTPAAAPVEERPTFTTCASEGDGIEGSRRRSRRVATSDEVGIRRIGSFNFNAKMHDVSTGGCRVELIEAYEAGDHVVTRLPKLEPLGARVCWAVGTTAGIEFLNAIHPAVFNSLLLRLSAPVSVTTEALPTTLEA